MEADSSRLRYEYEALPLSKVIGIIQHCEYDDSYITKDTVFEEYFRIIDLGFRWVRTEGDQAIFERALLKAQPPLNEA